MALSPTYLPDETGYLISAVNVDGTKYNIRDFGARNAISASLSVIDELSSIVQGGVHYIGRTTTALADGSHTNPITIGG